MKWSLATIVLVPRGTTAHITAGQWPGVLQWAAEAGFTGLEISPHWLNLSADGAELEHFRCEAAAAGLAICGINVNRCLFTEDSQPPTALARIRRAIDAAAILGAARVTLSLSLPIGASPRAPLRGCDVPESQRQQAADVLAEFAARAAQNQIALSLELHDDGLLDTAEYCLDMVRRVGAPNVGVNPDLGNLIRGGTSPVDWESALRQLAPLANNWHVKNYCRGQPAPLWDGQIDYARAMSIMHAAGYRGWVSIESYLGDVRELQQHSLAYLQRLAAALAGPAPSSRESAA